MNKSENVRGARTATQETEELRAAVLTILLSRSFALAHSSML